MPAKKTHEEYKLAFEKKYFGVLEFKDAQYIGAKEPITVYCPKHGKFTRQASQLLTDKRSKHPCPFCVKEILKQEVLEGWENYLNKIKKNVDCKNLDFSSVEYTGAGKPVKIKCNIHGMFKAIPSNMVSKKSGCPHCGRSNSKSLGADKILHRLQNIYGKKIKITVPKDARRKHKITYECIKHGLKTSTIDRLLKGSGCRDCATEASSKARSLSTEEWIEKAQAIHGKKYDYSCTLYVNAKTKVDIICPIHGQFRINPSNHISLKRGCKVCSGKSFKNWENSNKILSHEIFLERVSKHKHTNLDFKNTVYRGQKNTVRVECNLHGPFDAWPSNLFQGGNCPACAASAAGKKRRLELDTLIARISNKFGKKYEIDTTSIVSASSPIKLRCKTHGWFQKTIGNLESSNGCPLCSNENSSKIRALNAMLTSQEVIDRFQKVHNFRYDYSKIKYAGIMNSVEITCFTHGSFHQSVTSHLQGKGCPKCGAERKRQAQFLSQGDLYDRLKILNGDIFIYPPNLGLELRSNTPIICRQHGLFCQPLRIHLSGNGCPECSQSLGAKRVSEWLTKNEIEYVTEAHIPVGKKGLPLRADFFLPEYNTYIEYNGEQHFRPISFFGMDEKTSLHVFEEQKERDRVKENWIIENNYELVRIRYDQNEAEVLSNYFGLIKK